jgi:hypothetical protein
LAGGLLFTLGCDGEWSPTQPASEPAVDGTPLASSGFIFLDPVCDDAGPNDVPEQSDLNCFSRADNVSGRLGVLWSWDDVDQWTGEGQTGDACALFDTDLDSFANLAVCAQFTNTPDGLDIVQLPSAAAATVYECSDKKQDRCSKQVTLLTSTGTTSCAIAIGVEQAPWQGDDYPNDVLAECDLDLANLPAASNTNLLNVCSFPSGEPNSNPFDCVVTPGAGYLVIQKATTPTSAQTFTFTLDPGARDGTTSFTAPGTNGSGGPGATGLIAVEPNTTFQITETVPTEWTLASVSCSNGAGPVGTPDLANDRITGVSVATGQTVTCTFSDELPPTISVTKTATPKQVPETGGNVTYALVVTNTSGAALTLNSLNDDVFGDVAPGEGENNPAIVSSTCDVPQTLASAGQEGDSYECSFVATLSGNASNGEHVNEVTAAASNDAGNTTATDTETVTFGEVLPDISITKTPTPESVNETGGDVNYMLVVTNLSAEAATLNSLADDRFGDLNGQGTCSVPQSLAAAGENGDSYSCNFTKNISGVPGVPHVNEVTAVASDDDGNTDEAKATASVGIGAVDPTISVDKTASPTSVPETGGSVTYTVLIDNTSAETITLNSLTDSKFGDLNGKGDCGMPQTLQPDGQAGDSYTCTFTETVSGEAGSHINVATASGQDDDGQPVEGSDDATVTLEDVLPVITVSKTPDPTSVPETGGDVTYTVTVGNDALEVVTLVSLNDNQFGDLSGKGTCSVPQPLAAKGDPGDSYTCTFTESLSSLDLTDHVNTVTAVGKDNENNEDSEQASATVSFTDVLPDITVTKDASPGTVPETGGLVTYTVTVGNNSAEPVELTSLNDDRFGNLAGQGTCVLPQSLAPTGETGDSYQCTFERTLSNGVGTPHVNVVTAVGTDNEGNTDTETDDASVSFSAVAPTISVTKTASPTSVPETGGSVTWTVLVTNTGQEAVTLTGLSDNVFGDLTSLTGSTCATGGALAVSGTGTHTYSCQFTASISGNVGADHVNTVTATAIDDDGTEATANDDATVSFTDVPPDISVSKTVSPETLGGTTSLVGPPPPLGPVITSSTDPLYVPPVYDVDGPNDVPEQSDVNWFSRADNLTGELWVKWTWDDTDQWTGTGQTGDACGLFDANGNGNADLAVCAQITNNADGSQVLQLPSKGAATAYACSDKKADRCSKQVTLLTSIGSTTCSISVEPEPLPGAPWSGDDGADVVAECGLDLAALGAGSGTNLLNVCSFPSGEPNSNPFDCVVTPGAGFLLIEKDVSPASGQSFSFGLSPASLDGTSSFNVIGGGSSSLIPVAPTTSPANGYTITESQLTNWLVSGASCNGGATGTFNGTDAVSGIEVSTGQTVTCTFSNVWAFTGPVTYTIVVTNNSLEAATLNYLNDNVFGNLNGQGTCSLTQPLAATGQTGASYTCSFDKTLSGNAGDTHTNVVTARASDDEGGTDEETDDATVTFTGP